ncbi:MAG: UbiD family decarboxylase [Planctomycetia bacterium]|nr:UbiD family decarboxylase [Planctomycetia bacterium]
MGYRSLKQCVDDLERHRHLVRIDAEIDPNLEMAEIQRRVYQAAGPALLFTRPKNCRFPMVGNLFGTLERTRFLFRDTLDAVRRLVELKVEPGEFFKRPWRYFGVPFNLLNALPRRQWTGPILKHRTTLRQLPQLKCWPMDGGAFVTLPLVYSEDVNKPGWMKSNLGMYRVQLSGNDYVPDREVGLHYQIHRGIGVHHHAALRKGVPFRVNVVVGGPPALTLSAVMPLPEGMPELAFAGLLGGRRVGLVTPAESPLSMPAEADFVIVGTVGGTKPEGPFGDHLGYYSLTHDFPVLNVEAVYHRPDAIWPFTVVGRPPQEDTSFGEIIHEITGPVIPTVIPGIKAVHAVDAAGVHPLLLAIGSERYVPYAKERVPQELLTSACAILGQGQLSLAKYLMIVAHEDDPELDIHDIPAFFRHLLERVDWRRDLHFHTCTTADTLDYSATGFNSGSKVVIAAAGTKRRELGWQIPPSLMLADGFTAPRVCMPGVLAVQGSKASELTALCRGLERLDGFPLVLVVDDSDFASRHVNNWLWMTFTRSDPASDIHGAGATTQNKHWGCVGPLVIDARLKDRMAPPLVEDPKVTRRVDALAAPGGPLHGIY